MGPQRSCDSELWNRKKSNGQRGDLGVSSIISCVNLKNFLCFSFLICKTRGLHQFLPKTLFQGKISLIELSGGRGHFSLGFLRENRLLTNSIYFSPTTRQDLCSVLNTLSLIRTTTPSHRLRKREVNSLSKVIAAKNDGDRI